MGKPEIMIVTGLGMITLGLLALVFVLGRLAGERRAAREHVRNLEQSRVWLAEQRAELDRQRAALAEQRAHLDVRRRRMPDSGRAPAPRADEQPTREIDRRRIPRVPDWLDLPDHLNKRGHQTRYDGEN